MGYTEECKNHGQYKGDYCGECVEEQYAEVARLRLALEDVEVMLQNIYHSPDEPTLYANYMDARARIDKALNDKK